MALGALSEEDPTFRVKTNEETGQTIIMGMGELHLEILRDRMFREFAVEANVGKPEVSYKETITIPASTETKYVKQIRRPRAIRSRMPGNRTERAWQRQRDRQQDRRRRHSEGIHHPAVSKGSKKASQTGVLAGYPLVDMKVAITYGSYHEVDSNEMAFKICASMAVKEAARKAKPIHPRTDHESRRRRRLNTNMGDVIGDINRRRGKILGQESVKGIVDVTLKCLSARCLAIQPTALDDFRTRHLYDGAKPFRAGSHKNSRRNL